jgi:hypothetical protein
MITITIKTTITIIVTKSKVFSEKISTKMNFVFFFITGAGGALPWAGGARLHQHVPMPAVPR